jgi:tryptophan synthase alpha subunit
VARLVDAVVVGSAIVKFIEDNGAAPELPARLESWTRQITSPLRSRALL